MELGSSVARESLGAVITLVGMSQHCTVVVYIVIIFFFFLISCEFNLISYYSRKKKTWFDIVFVFFLTKGEPLLRNGLNRTYCSVSARLKCQF